jgi:hypothetical protein
MHTQLLFKILKGKRPCGRHRTRWEDLNLGRKGCSDTIYIKLNQPEHLYEFGNYTVIST